MASEQELFHVSGPFYLTNCVNWRNSCHRRSVAASLVRGVYILEKDRHRQNIQREANANAPPWWEQFHFKLNRILVDDSDSSYFGAIFELESAHSSFYQSNSNPNPPKFVIAFRGTISRSIKESDDLKLSIKCVFNKLEQTFRFRKAFQAVSDTVATAGPTNNVWLAGHSLGASIAMLAGRNMAKSGYHLETYLFNPPFISVPIENIIRNETLKHSVRIGCSFLKAGIEAMHRRKKDPGEDPFVVLSEWKPHVFVNPSDPICAEYIGYFQHREKMEEIGVGRIERLATRHSIGSLVLRAIGRGSEPSHLLPTAYLTVNISPSEDSTQAHKLHQWWQRNVQCKSKLHKFT